MTLIDETGTILLFDAMAEHLFGWRASEIVGRNVVTLMPAEYRHAHTSQLASYLASGASHVIGRELEVSGLRRDGAVFPIALRVSELRLEGGRRVFVGVIQDMRSRRTVAEADAADRASVSLLQAALEATADGILVVDRDGRMVRYNQQFVSMWQLPVDLLARGSDNEAIGFVLSQLSHPESFLEKIRVLYADPTVDSFDVLEFKDGRVFERYSKPQWIAGQPAGRVWSFRDVSGRRSAEDALRQSASSSSGSRRRWTLLAASRVAWRTTSTTCCSSSAPAASLPESVRPRTSSFAR